MAQLGLTGMPERLFACTPSRLATWQDCPRRYRMTYLDRPRLPQGPPAAHTSLGVAVHNALREWWLQPLARRTPDRAGALLRGGWSGLGFRDVEHSAAWAERSAAMVTSYAATLDPAVEPVAVERTVATKTPRLAVSGRVDRLDEREGRLVVVDYKTGRRPLGADDARGSAALALYALAAARTLRRSCHRVELHHLPTGAVHVAEHTDATLARHLARVEVVAAEAVAAERSLTAGEPGAREEAFPARPGPLCGWCERLAHCPEGRSSGPRREPWAALGEP